MSKKIRRWLRTFHTVRHLKLLQIWYFFLRRIIGPTRITSFPEELTLRKISIHSVLQLKHTDDAFSDYSFDFLNSTLTFPKDGMNWCPADAQRLWRYNLHYFDFLRDAERPLSQKIALLDDWIANNPQGSEPAWEPYTASLRIVNWCLFFWSLPPEKIRSEWLSSLYLQARWLERNLELHILANHYFENVKAMLFSAIFFDTSNSSHWLAHFQNELAAQLHEQTLSDGGHYERSPQYHCILLEDYLDLYALISQNNNLVKTETINSLTCTIVAGLKFLAMIVTPDDDIPLFNDSASGTASRPSMIFAKAQELGFDIKIHKAALIDLPDSGLFGWKSGGDYFLIDCGNIGPAYQPGHTHCDFLSFVLMLNHQWIVVDSGVYEYEPGPMRHYVRSTAAHNTITIDNYEQSEIWGEFRVGRRANRLHASISKDGNKVIFEGAYQGFPASKARITHRRTVSITLDDAGDILEVEVIDDVNGKSTATHQIKSLLHLHPSTDCLTQGEAIIIGLGTQSIASIDAMSLSQSSESWFCPQFGVKLANQQLQTFSHSTLPEKLSYKLKRI